MNNLIKYNKGFLKKIHIQKFYQVITFKDSLGTVTFPVEFENECITINMVGVGAPVPTFVSFMNPSKKSAVIRNINNIPNETDAMIFIAIGY